MKSYMRNEKVAFHALFHKELIEDECYNIQQCIHNFPSFYEEQDNSLDESFDENILIEKIQKVKHDGRIRTRFRQERREMHKLKHLLKKKDKKIKELNLINSRLTNEATKKPIVIKADSKEQRIRNKLKSYLQMYIDEKDKARLQEIQLQSINFFNVLSFDSIMQYSYYFPHNNASEVLREIQEIKNGQELRPDYVSNMESEVLDEYMKLFDIDKEIVEERKHFKNLSTEKTKNFFQISIRLLPRQRKKTQNLIKFPQKSSKKLVFSTEQFPNQSPISKSIE